MRTIRKGVMIGDHEYWFDDYYRKTPYLFETTDGKDWYMSDEIKAVEIRAELRQIKTMADGTANLVLNIPEDCREQVKIMLDWLKEEVKIVMVCTTC